LEVLQDIAAEPTDDRPSRQFLPIIPEKVSEQAVRKASENRTGSQKPYPSQSNGADRHLRQSSDDSLLFEVVIDHIGVALSHRALGTQPFGIRRQPSRDDVASHPGVAGAGVDRERIDVTLDRNADRNEAGLRIDRTRNCNALDLLRPWPRERQSFLPVVEGDNKPLQ